MHMGTVGHDRKYVDWCSKYNPDIRQGWISSYAWREKVDHGTFTRSGFRPADPFVCHNTTRMVSWNTGTDLWRTTSSCA